MLGGMKELGKESVFYHGEIGRFLKTMKHIDLIALFGEETGDTFSELGNGQAEHFNDKEQLIDYLKGRLKPGDTVLIKGSRAFKMEEIVEALK